MCSAAYVWAKVLGYLEAMLGSVIVQTWFDDTESVAVTDKQLVLYSPTEFHYQVIEKNYMEHIREGLHQYGFNIEPVLWTDEEYNAHLAKQDRRSAFSANPQFTLENYIAGSSNQIPLKIAAAVANDPGQSIYNPLFLYGPSGVGKTHLLYAIANALHASRQETKVVYVRGEAFTSELIDAIRKSNTAEFRAKYRTADVLLVDDIQFIAGKDATQAEFFHTFNELYEHHKQIVMTADRCPSAMATLEDRLKSRFGEGIMVGIEAPDRETRLMILRAKAKLLGLTLSVEIFDYLADMLTDNVRQIEGALKKIRVFHDLENIALSKENVAKIVEDLCQSPPTQAVTAEHIIDTVCRYYGIDHAQIFGQQRSKTVTEPRQISMYLCRTVTGLSFPKIGEIFGRDHGTVQHSIKKIAALLQSNDSHLCRIVEEMNRQLQE